MRTLREEMKEGATRLAQPIDFEALTAQGLLKKEGLRYRVWSIHELPRHFSDHIVEMRTTTAAPGVLVKFKLPSQKASKSSRNGLDLSLGGAHDPSLNRWRHAPHLPMSKNA